MRRSNENRIKKVFKGGYVGRYAPLFVSFTTFSQEVACEKVERYLKEKGFSHINVRDYFDEKRIEFTILDFYPFLEVKSSVEGGLWIYNDRGEVILKISYEDRSRRRWGPILEEICELLEN